MIDYDPTNYPTGVGGWQALLQAIENANRGDENQWVEFKANINLSRRVDRPVVAKAIVAFANRDPDRSRQWLDGRALVVIGLEPGNVVGTEIHDSADLHNWIDPFLADPSPGWDFQYLAYKGKQVLVIIVEPPRIGDPIHCIGANGDQVQDGDVYVRKTGQSPRGTSDDIRRLSERLLARTGPGLKIGVTADAGDGIPVCEWPPDWIDPWVDAERKRLMKPLEPKRNPQAPGPRRSTTKDKILEGSKTPDEQDATKPATLRDAIMRGTSLGSLMTDPFNTTQPENRTREQYEAQVERYLAECRRHLPDAVPELRRTSAHRVVFSAQNLTETNYQRLLVRLHIEGDVEAYDEAGGFEGLDDFHPDPPRIWGPWKRPNDLLSPIINQSLISPAFTLPRPRPEITNGGSATIVFLPVDVRPGQQVILDEIGISALSTVTGPIVCTWSATAKNVDGVLEGTFTMPLSGRVIDFSARLEHRSH